MYNKLKNEYLPRKCSIDITRMVSSWNIEPQVHVRRGINSECWEPRAGVLVRSCTGASGIIKVHLHNQ